MSRTIRWGWAGVLVVAALVRLSALNASPLMPDETLLAVPALDLARGLGWPGTMASPLLTGGSALFFFLFGPGDGVARFLPALAGIAFVALPWFWRRWLGEIGALVAAAFLALSPLAWTGSRTLDPAMLGALGAGYCLTAFFAHEAEEPWLLDLLAGLGLFLGLNGGPTFFDALIPGLLAWVAYRWAWEGDLLTWNLPRKGLLLGLLAAWLIAFGLGSNWSGSGGLLSGLGAWWMGWYSAMRDTPAPFLVMMYEPALLFAALVGGVKGVQANRPLPVVLGLWSLFAGLILTLRAGATAVSATAMLLPLVLLVGTAIQDFEINFVSEWWGERLIYAGGSLVLWFIFFQTLAHHGAFGPTEHGLDFILLAVLLLFQFFLWLIMGRLWKMPEVTTGVLLSTVTFLLIIQLGFGVRSLFTDAHNSADLLSGRKQTSFDLSNLNETMRRLVWYESLREADRPVYVVAGQLDWTSVVRWSLRNWPEVRVVESWPSQEATGMVVAPEGVQPLEGVGTLLSRSFVALEEPSARVPACVATMPGGPLSCQLVLNWYLYRSAYFPNRLERALLWSIP